MKLKAPANGVWKQRERGEDPNLDCGIGVRSGGDRAQTAETGGQPVSDSTDSQPHAFRENAHFMRPSGHRRPRQFHGKRQPTDSVRVLTGQQCGDISPRDHELLRFSLRARDELMNLTLGSEEAFSERTVSQILKRLQSEIASEKDALIMQERAQHQAEAAKLQRETQAKLEEERVRFLTAKAQLEEAVRRQTRTCKRLFWFSERVSGFMTVVLVILIAVVLIGGSFVSEGYVKKLLPGYRWVSFVVAGAAWLALAWGVFHAIFGVSVKDLGQKTRSTLQNTFYLCSPQDFFG
jgi:succinate dehydrogenase hydrophobic anchor subunit